MDNSMTINAKETEIQDTVSKVCPKILDQEIKDNMRGNSSSSTKKCTISLHPDLFNIVANYKGSFAIMLNANALFGSSKNSDNLMISRIRSLVDIKANYIYSNIVDQTNDAYEADLYDSLPLALTYYNSIEDIRKMFLYFENNQILKNCIENNNTMALSSYSDFDILDIDKKQYTVSTISNEMFISLYGTTEDGIRQVIINDLAFGARNYASGRITGLAMSSTIAKLSEVNKNKIRESILILQNISHDFTTNLYQAFAVAPIGIDLALNNDQGCLEGYADNCYIYKQLIDYTNSMTTFQSTIMDIISKYIPEHELKGFVLAIDNSKDLINALKVFSEEVNKETIQVSIVLSRTKEKQETTVKFGIFGLKDVQTTSGTAKIQTSLILNFKLINVKANKAIYEMYKKNTTQWCSVKVVAKNIGNVNKVLLVNRKNDANKLYFIGESNKIYPVKLIGKLPSDHIAQIIHNGPLAYHMLYQMQKHDDIKFLFNNIDGQNLYSCQGLNINKSYYLLYDYGKVARAISQAYKT